MQMHRSGGLPWRRVPRGGADLTHRPTAMHARPLNARLLLVGGATYAGSARRHQPDPWKRAAKYLVCLVAVAWTAGMIVLYVINASP